jgi:hypothetical protein
VRFQRIKAVQEYPIDGFEVANVDTKFRQVQVLRLKSGKNRS